MLHQIRQFLVEPLVMRISKVMAVFSLAVIVAACQNTAAPLPPLPPQQIESGSTLTLIAPLTFKTGSELLFQGQRQVSPSALEKTRPYCKLVSQNGASHSLTPGPMRVGKVDYDEREAGATSAMYSVTRIALTAAPSQPAYTLTCGWPEPRSSAQFLTSEQIYSAIGGQFTMQLQR